MTDVENQTVFRSPLVVQGFTDREGWLDHGERISLLTVAPLARSGRVLDIGVGAGRTASLLRLMTDAYVAIDYAPEMVDLCRRLHPDVEVLVGDARDLNEFPAASFSMTFFSNNGIDAVDEPGRRRILEEMHRVLVEDGALVLCTLNKHGRSYGETPWQLHRPGQPTDRSPKSIARWCWTMASDPMRVPRRYRNWFVSRRAAVDRGGWAMFPLAAHDFSLVVHYVTLERLREELRTAGFEVKAFFDSISGRPIPVDAPDTDADAIYVVATKRGPGA